MQGYLKKYKVIIDAVSPIYIGGGEKLGKKEYIYMPWNHHVIVPDIQKMYEDLANKKLAKEYEAFMMDSRNKQMTLSQWLAQHKFKEDDYKKWARYEMDAGDAFTDRNCRPKDIDAFVKDAYGFAYVPGSSIKGMLRTVILIKELLEHTNKYENDKQQIKNNAQVKKKRTQYLQEEMKQMEMHAFHTLNRDEKKAKNAVNDCLAGLYVGDSLPIPLDHLTLSQKIDLTLDGKRKPLPILRETLMPGTQIIVDLTIDTTLCPYDIDDIMDAIDLFQGLSNQYFYDRFQRKVVEDYAVFLGGGCGFVSKTILYALFEEEAVPVIDKVFQVTLGPNYHVHKHEKDVKLNIAPHVCKCTLYHGTLFDMGIGKISYEEV